MIFFAGCCLCWGVQPRRPLPRPSRGGYDCGRLQRRIPRHCLPNHQGTPQQLLVNVAQKAGTIQTPQAGQSKLIYKVMERGEVLSQKTYAFTLLKYDKYKG